MRGLIRGEIAGREAIGQRDRLMEREAQPFPGDRIHGAGCVSDQRDIAAIDARQAASSR